MARWGRRALASIAAIAVGSAIFVAHRNSTPASGNRNAGGKAAGTSQPAPDHPSASNPPPVSQAPRPPSPQPRQPVTPRYDAGDFKDVDPKPARYELRAWAMLNRKTGEMTGSKNSATAHNSTESMIKAWIAADYFRGLRDGKPSPYRLHEIRGMIRDSDDGDAQALYAAGGFDAVVHRLVKTCRLKNTSVWPGWWSRTQMTAQDAVRMGECIASGKAAGRKWTGYLLNEMRHVRGEGRFGIIDALPSNQQKHVAIKNGWTAIGWDHGQWHVNCLAITDDWVLAVQAKYPIRLGLRYGAAYCQSTSAKVLSETERKMPASPS